MNLRRAVLPFLAIAIAAPGCGWAKRKPYDNNPLLRQQKPVIGAPGAPAASSTPAEPYPPPRPILPADPAYIRNGLPPSSPVTNDPDPPPLDPPNASGPAVPSSRGKPGDDAKAEPREGLPTPSPLPELELAPPTLDPPGPSAGAGKSKDIWRPVSSPAAPKK
jgi:hypothetical protein